MKTFLILILMVIINLTIMVGSIAQVNSDVTGDSGFIDELNHYQQEAGTISSLDLQVKQKESSIDFSPPANVPLAANNGILAQYTKAIFVPIVPSDYRGIEYIIAFSIMMIIWGLRMYNLYLIVALFWARYSA